MPAKKQPDKKTPAKKTETKGKHPGGRPTKYNATYHPKLAYLLARIGETDKKIAEELGITESTLNLWKQKHKEFSESLKAGKDTPDDLVEAALLKKALGYEEEDTKIFQYEGEPVYAPYTKKFAPDTTAAIFWLKNRRPLKWRDKQEVDLGLPKDSGVVILGAKMSMEEWQKQQQLKKEK